MSSLLVEYVTVEEVNLHPNADRLEIVPVKGWQCIIQKGQFNVGDKALFVPIDAVPPAWMVDKYGLEYLKNGSRVRTVRLRGEISQGLLLTLEHLPPGVSADKLGITKWEPPEPAYFQGRSGPMATRNRPNPNFTRYCDPENIKNYPDVFKPDDLVVVTEKIHGANGRWGWVPRYYKKGFWGGVKRLLLGRWLNEWEWCVGSRRVHLVGGNPCFYEGNPWGKIAAKYDLKNVVPKGHTLYGEVYGPGIQDLTYGRNEIDVVFFDAKKGERYLDAYDFFALMHSLALPRVPYLAGREWGFVAELLPSLLCGPSALHSGTIREGVVIKAADESNTCRIGRKILKTFSDEYLLRKNGTEHH